MAAPPGIEATVLPDASRRSSSARPPTSHSSRARGSTSRRNGGLRSVRRRGARLGCTRAGRAGSHPPSARRSRSSGLRMIRVTAKRDASRLLADASLAVQRVVVSRRRRSSRNRPNTAGRRGRASERRHRRPVAPLASRRSRGNTARARPRRSPACRARPPRPATRRPCPAGDPHPLLLVDRGPLTTQRTRRLVAGDEARKSSAVPLLRPRRERCHRTAPPRGRTSRGPDCRASRAPRRRRRADSCRRRT